MAKPRSDSLHARLGTDELREEVLSMAHDAAKSYDDIMAWLESEHGIKTSLGALANFSRSHGVSWRWERARSIAQTFSDTIPKEVATQAKQALTRQYLAQTLENLSPKDLYLLKIIEFDERKLDLEERKLAQQDRRIALLEAKAAQADLASNVLKDNQLTTEQKQDKFRQIFGMA